MARVTVTKVDDEWVVNFPISDEEFIVLPADSTRTEPEEGVVRYGTATTYLETKDFPMRSFSYMSSGMPISFVMLKTSRGRDTTTRQREDAFQQLEEAWAAKEEPAGDPEEEERPEDPGATEGGRKLRLKKQTRRSKRNTRNNKRRKLRKLTTRRR